MDGGSQAIMYTCFFTACAALMVSVCVCMYVYMYIIKLQQYCRLSYEQCTKLLLISRSCKGGVELGTGNETDFVTCEVWNVLC